MTDRTRTVRTTAPRGIAKHLPELRTALEQQRRFRVDQLDDLAVEAASPRSTADEPRIQVTTALTLAAMAALVDIDAALRRLDRGSYGRCEQCRTAIPLERLEILPMSRYCMRCQRAVETKQPTPMHRAAHAVGSDTGRRHARPP
jgi:RNA polymerase-binding transcription factor DksA